MNILVKPDISGAASPCLASIEPFDIELAMHITMKIMASAEILEDLSKLETESAEERLSNHVQHLGSEMGDASSDLMTMLLREQERLESLKD